MKRQADTFSKFDFTLNCGKEPITKQQGEKLSKDLPSRLSLDSLNVNLFNLSTSSSHEDTMGLTSCWLPAYIRLTFKHGNDSASTHIELFPEIIYWCSAVRPGL